MFDSESPLRKCSHENRSASLLVPSEWLDVFRLEEEADMLLFERIQRMTLLETTSY